jgi:hypothetical protein
MNLDKFVEGIVVVLILFMAIILFITNSYNQRIKDLEMDNLHLRMQIGTNKMLIKQNQRLYVSDELALKEEIDE